MAVRIVLYISNLKFLFCVQKFLSILNPEVYVSMDFYRLMRRVLPRRYILLCNSGQTWQEHRASASQKINKRHWKRLRAITNNWFPLKERRLEKYVVQSDWLSYCAKRSFLGNDGRFKKEHYPYHAKATGHSLNTFSRRTIMEIF